jgi:hypothetical protein
MTRLALTIAALVATPPTAALSEVRNPGSRPVMLKYALLAAGLLVTPATAQTTAAPPAFELQVLRWGDVTPPNIYGNRDQFVRRGRMIRVCPANHQQNARHV